MDKTYEELAGELHQHNLSFIHLVKEAKMIYEVALQSSSPEREKLLSEALVIQQKVLVETALSVSLQKKIIDAQQKEIQNFAALQRVEVSRI